MNRRSLSWAALIFMSALYCTMAGASSVTVTDDRSKTIRVDTPPRRIVSLLPSLTETVCTLGRCDSLVGTDRYSNWPDAVITLPKLGGIEDAEVEHIVALHPDIVLASLSARVVDRLEELGIPVVVLEANSLADVKRILLIVGRIVGTPEQAEAAWRQIDADIDAAAARVPDRWQGRRVYFEVSEAPHAAGASSFIGELLTRLKLVNVAPAELGPFPMLNPEYVVRAQPDLIMSSRRELTTMPARPGWPSLTAIKHHHTCGFSAAAFDVLVRPGPRLGQAAMEVADCLSRLASEPSG